MKRASMRLRDITHRCARSAAIGAALLAGSVVRADRREWQLSPVGTLGAVSVAAAGRSVWSLAGGAGLRAAYGVTNFFEVGVVADFATTQGIFLPGVLVGGQPGNLVGNLWTVGAALDLRLVGNTSLSRYLARVHPFIGVRGGGLVRMLTSQQLRDNQNLFIVSQNDDVTVLPMVSGYVGAEYRIGRAWLLGLSASFSYATSAYYSATGTVELSWSTYATR